MPAGQIVIEDQRAVGVVQERTDEVFERLVGRVIEVIIGHHGSADVVVTIAFGAEGDYERLLQALIGALAAALGAGLDVQDVGSIVPKR